MAEIRIEWNVLEEWIPALEQIVKSGQLEAFSTYAETAGVVASHSLSLYQGYLKGMPLPNGAALQRVSGNLAKGARLEEPDFLDFRLENSVAYAEAIENGTAERDLKAMLKTAKKARRAKDGSLYLIIPMRHGVPGSIGLPPMPASIHGMAQKLERSRIVGTKMELSGTGHMVQRNIYNKGYSKNSLTVDQIQGAGGSLRDQNRYQGMYKFGKAKHTSYITFRVISEKSKGWVIPARPGLFPARTAATQAFTDGKSLLAEALTDDILRMAGL